MTYWRMQVHPARPNLAVKHTVESLAAGYIGLDFAGEVGDLFATNQSTLPENQWTRRSLATLFGSLFFTGLFLSPLGKSPALIFPIVGTGNR
jgi:hypothetical protein